jgi:hypothetical protein
MNGISTTGKQPETEARFAMRIGKRIASNPTMLQLASASRLRLIFNSQRLRKAYAIR